MCQSSTIGAFGEKAIWLADRIDHERGIKLSKRAVSRLLGHLGLSPHRPIHESYRQDTKKIEWYLTSMFPALIE
jgi:transposase